VVLFALLVIVLLRDQRQRNQLLAAVSRAHSQSEDRYRRLVEAAPVGGCIHDRREGRDANEALLALFGVTESDLRPTPADPRANHAAAIRELLLAVGADQRASGVSARSDGQAVSVETVGIGIVDDDHEAVLVVVHDVSERTRMEAELRAQRASLRQIIDTVP